MNSATQYRFESSDRDAVICFRGDGPPTMTGGGGGWEIEARPRRVGATLWKGREPYQMDVPILFDGFQGEDSQESKIALLNQMQMGKDLDPPPIVTIEGAVPVKGASWVISIAWGDNVVWRPGTKGQHYRIRQDAIVSCTQYQQDRRVNLRKPPMQRKHRVKKGDTLKSIAKKYKTTVAKLKKLNGIRDAKTLHKRAWVRVR